MERGTLETLDQARHICRIINRRGEIGNVCIALAHVERNHGILLAGDQFVESLERARIFAKKAVEVDEMNPRAHAEFAMQEMFSKRQNSDAETYRHALSLNPYDPLIRADWADCLVNLGRADEALPILEEVLTGWPRNRTWVEWGLCDAYWALGRPDRIVELLERHPDQPYVHRYLAASYARLGNPTRRNCMRTRCAATNRASPPSRGAQSYPLRTRTARKSMPTTWNAPVSSLPAAPT